jgi:hypothetical protein
MCGNKLGGVIAMGMPDETLIEPFAAQEFFVDGFADHKIINGIFTCAGYRLQQPSRTNGEPLKVVVMRIVMPANMLGECIELAKLAKNEVLAIVEPERLGRH